MSQNGTFGKQSLHERIIKKKESSIYRQAYLTEKLSSNVSDGIEIYWFVTFDDKNQRIPTAVEAQMIQEFFDHHNHLPEWNKSF